MAGRDIEVEDDRPFVLEGETRRYDFEAGGAEAVIRPVSRTFIRSRLADNPYLTASGYMATLQAMPEPLRSQMLEGDFAAGAADDRWQVIPSAWVEQAMARWRGRDTGTQYLIRPDTSAAEDAIAERIKYCVPVSPVGPMDSLGVDVARGGRDQTIIARRHGTWFAPLICLEGSETPDGPSLAGQVMAARRDRAVVHIDVVGWGASPYDFLKSNGIQTVAVNGASRGSGRSREAQIPFANRRAELWWRMREALDPHAEAPVALPPDPALKADLCAPRWRQTLSGIQIEAKEDVAARIGRSPDRGDAACMALMATPKAGLTAGRRASGAPVSWMG